MNETRRTTPIVLACAISAGVHLGLVPEHLHEAPALGVSFIVSVFLLALATVAVALRPNDLRAVRLTGLLLAGLLVAFAASRTTGLPLLQPDREELDAVGLITQIVQASGLGFALLQAHQLGGRRLPITQEATP